MPINLSKGQKVDLTKKNPGLKKIMVGLGWDVNAFDSGSDFDRSIMICSSSPSPSPVRLSPMWMTDSLACFRLP